MKKLFKALLLCCIFTGFVFAETITCPETIICDHDNIKCYLETGELISDAWEIEQVTRWDGKGSNAWVLARDYEKHPERRNPYGVSYRDLDHSNEVKRMFCSYIQRHPVQNDNGYSMIILGANIKSFVGLGWEKQIRFPVVGMSCKKNSSPEECAAIR